MPFGAGEVHIGSEFFGEVQIYGASFGPACGVAVNVNDAVRRFLFLARIGPDHAGLIVGAEFKPGFVAGNVGIKGVEVGCHGGNFTIGQGFSRARASHVPDHEQGQHKAQNSEKSFHVANGFRG